ncbi:MAG: 16S rRNA (guanine(527)-N(7))-methyltransferase RsmG [Candidatus Faecimonas sp.]|nr:16S rRNA (guanine(527)-N(7))-methyltransferase RsmG [Mycoplasmatota bacterium]MDY2908881.1 16S rRNA (guanine(527)-N(7))-methyltransferase RsmG [Candidatus Faecimonas sp.]
MTEQEFIDSIKELGIEPTDKQLYQLSKFYELLIEWNQKINLTRITDKKEVYLKHFYDSLTISKELDLNKINTLCDVGTGAGFPGIVLKIFYPDLKITLIDSLLKRVKYLNEIIKELNLKEIKAIHTRAEDYKETFDIVTARAVANIEKLLTYTMHLVKKDGKLIAMKGNIDEEITEDVRKRIDKKYKLIKINKFYLPKEESHRSLVIIGKKGL